MGLATRIRALFSEAQPCQTCEAQRAHIAFLEEELRFRRSETEGVRFQLYKALRLEPVDRSPVERHHMEPVNTGRGGKSWPKLKADLEARAKRKGPEDERKAYWQEKVDAMEREAGLDIDHPIPTNGVEQPDPAAGIPAQFLEDMKELAQ